MNKKIITLFVAILCSSTILTGCATNSTNALRVGMTCTDYAPYNFSTTKSSDTALETENGFCEGYDAKVAQLLSEKLNRPIQLEKIAFEGLVLALQSGEIDVIVSGMTPTTERQKEISFSDPYWMEDIVLGTVVLKEGAYAQAKELGDFNAARLTAELNTWHVDLLKQFPTANPQPEMKTFGEMALAIEAGELDGIVCDSDLAASVTSSNNKMKFIPLSDFKLNPEIIGLSVGVRKDDTELLAEVNQILADFTLEQRQEAMNYARMQVNNA